MMSHSHGHSQVIIGTMPSSDNSPAWGWGSEWGVRTQLRQASGFRCGLISNQCICADMIPLDGHWHYDEVVAKLHLTARSSGSRGVETQNCAFRQCNFPSIVAIKIMWQCQELRYSILKHNFWRADIVWWGEVPSSLTERCGLYSLL